MIISSAFAAGLIIAFIVVGSRALAGRTRLPYAVFLVVGGTAVSFLPHIPSVTLRPQVVFLGLLPPLVYHAGLVTSPRELKANALPIGLSAVGLVLATTFAVTALAWQFGARMGWTGAFILGSVVAPTDPVAATAVLNRLGGPADLTSILEGESLVNDGIALALFSLAVGNLSSPTSVGGGFLDFLRIAGGGTAFGLIVGWVVSRARRPLRDTSSQVVVSLLVPYVAYLPADALGLSGVLATLCTGLALGQSTVAALEPSGRLRVAEFWEVLVFLLESTLFVLVGLQLRHAVDALSGYQPAHVAAVTIVAVVGVVAVRLLWWAALPNFRWRPEGRIFDTGAVPWRHRLVLGWSGLRGAISLAAALSVPAVVAGHPYGPRNIIVFAAFAVLLVTLIGQGTSLPWLLRRLELVGHGDEPRQRLVAARRCAEAALRRLDELAAAGDISDETAEGLRRTYERRIERARTQLGERDEGQTRKPAQDAASMAALQRRLLEAEYEVLQRMYRSGDISYAVLRQLRRDLDLEMARIRP